MKYISQIFIFVSCDLKFDTQNDVLDVPDEESSFVESYNEKVGSILYKGL